MEVTEAKFNIHWHWSNLKLQNFIQFGPKISLLKARADYAANLLQNATECSPQGYSLRLFFF